jgi:hypothetical protein
VYADRKANGLWHVHDNSDASMRLMFDSIDIDSPRIQSWLAELSSGVTWNDQDDQLECLDIAEADLVPVALKIAQACTQLQAMTALRTSREESTFKEEVIKLLREVEKETGVSAKYDTPLDEKQFFISDCLFQAKRPLAIMIATTPVRLLEAELAWSELKRIDDPTRVIAVVEDPKQIGIKQVSRAEYFTEKTYAFRDFEKAFRDAIKNSVTVH